MSTRRGWWVLVASLGACGLFTGCGTILGIEDFTPAADSGDGGSGTDAGGTKGDAGSGSDAHKGDGGAGKEGGVGRKGDSGSDSDADLDGEGDSESNDGTADEGTADVGSDIDASEGGCPATASGKGGTLNWADQFGVSGSMYVMNVALDPTSGDAVLTGDFVGSTNFGGGLVSGGDAGGGAFLARFDSAGHYKWAQPFDGSVNSYITAVDSSGNVLFGGSFSGTADFGNGAVTSTGSLDIFLAKYSSTGGAPLWVKHFGAGPAAAPYGAAFDSSGNLYVVGQPSAAALDVGCGAMAAETTEFVAEFDPSGGCTWGHGYGSRTSTAYTKSETLALDPTGNVFVAGGFFGTVDFGTGNKTAPGVGMDVFVQKFSPAGVVLLAKTFGVGASVAEATGIGTDCNGNLLLDGTFSQTINFGCETLTESGGNSDIFVAKLDPSGECLWSNSYGDADLQLGGPLAVDGAGGPAITGYFTGTVDFGGGMLTGSAADDQDTEAMYIAKFDSAGHYNWAYGGGPPSSNDVNSIGFGIAANGSAVVATGTFETGVLSIAGDPLTDVSVQDSYLASFVP